LRREVSRVMRSMWAGPVDLRKRRTPRAWASGRANSVQELLPRRVACAPRVPPL